MSDSMPPANRLAATASPYLRQHARNPVDWWPWCDAALAEARAQDRPILLSIGYSACHWCHVMAHESFEDPATAALMNRLFVNIKVDREERPDLDRIYQTAHQLLSSRAGGWPLTVFLTPETLEPFFCGTYFPREPRHGLPAFRQLLEGVERAFREQREAIREQSQGLMAALAELAPRAGAIPDSAPLEGARRQLAASFDAARGGFGGAPKFPRVPDLELLLRHWAATDAAGQPDARALAMVTFTLERMIAGGINDQVGGGFYRYSVDDAWMIPHFEKMLYDNAQLLALCCDAWQATSEPVFRAAAEATADWVIGEMQSDEGGYYSALDADSEGQEGRYYVWTREELEGTLAPEEFAAFAARYGLDGPANFEGRWHLHAQAMPAEVAGRLGLTVAQVEGLIDGARRKLLEVRRARVRPACDEKVLTAWNALMIKGMARAARVLARPDYLASAERALGLVRSTLWRDGRLLASYMDGTAHLPAYLDDHAMLIDALLELLQVRWRRDDLRFAIELAEILLARFEDSGEGGFFFTASDHETLIHRPKPLADESLPAGNAVAARVFQRLGHLLGEPRYLEAAARVLAVAGGDMRRAPYAHASLLMALDEHLEPGETVVVRAPPTELPPWLAELQQTYRPRRSALGIPADEQDLPGNLASMGPGPGARAYLCRGTHCEAPIEELARLPA
ncbi:thioredoxin domain protein [Thioflavicoccus mobilis 8321]|uniref:Thioredoxin domain protein n=1 Tax=Thioflavicoccus mobilis 8321 TaxID=765912 RepID=L0GSW2_9GAMM|nr:thioredoxin domain-containing protein [Thioflavicoccus mobilis]AGA89858.1 thioredoxin domain protein [Thioflavicoccus mobilis 8321]